MNKEIGGYFGLEQLCGKEFYSKLIKLNTARNALLYILKARNIEKIYIPYFLCDSVYELCEREGRTYEFYNIDEKFLPKFEKKLNEKEYLYIVNYYGQLNKKQILKIKQKHQNIILDNVQAFFQKPIKGIDTIYSCRKFFGVPDGAYLSTDVMLNESFKIGESRDRFKHVLGRYELGRANEFYPEFKDKENDLKSLEMTSMSNLSQNILTAVDYKAVCRKREKNFKTLANKLGKYNKLEIVLTKGPYVYPFYCNNAKKRRELLSVQGIYIPTLWPNVLDCNEKLEKDYAENILPLPCDQRYAEEEMLYLANKILESND